MFDHRDIIRSVSGLREDYWIEEFTKRGALWIHSGDSKDPHALLTSGKHSSGFFNASKIVGEHPRLAFEASAYLCNEIKRYCGKSKPMDWIFGSAHGATCIANNMGVLLNTPAGFTEKSCGDGSELMKVNKRFKIKRNDNILMVEDVITTGNTTIKSIRALEIDGGLMLSFIVSFVNRSGSFSLDGKRIISLIKKDMPVWDPEGCPLCAVGSEVVRPKENWAKLTNCQIC